MNLLRDLFLKCSAFKTNEAREFKEKDNSSDLSWHFLANFNGKIFIIQKTSFRELSSGFPTLKKKKNVIFFHEKFLKAAAGKRSAENFSK